MLTKHKPVSLLTRLRHALNSGAAHRRRKYRNSAAVSCAEALEQRVLMTAINWGNPAGGAFHVDGNWQPYTRMIGSRTITLQHAPREGDSAVFDLGDASGDNTYGVGFGTQVPEWVNTQLIVGDDDVRFELHGRRYRLTGPATPGAPAVIVGENGARFGGDDAVLMLRNGVLVTGTVVLGQNATTDSFNRTYRAEGTVNLENTVIEVGNRVTVGDAGRGTLNVAANSAVNAQTTATLLIVGGDDTGIGTVNIAGLLGSTETPYGPVIVGSLGTGALNIEGGGRASVNQLTIGVHPGSRGTTAVRGVSSRIDASRIHVGGTHAAAGGLATLEIADHGFVETPILQLWQTGTVRIDGGILIADNIDARGGTIDWVTGTVQTEQLNVGPTGPLGADASITAEQVLYVNDTLTIVPQTNLTAGGTLKLDGGQILVGAVNGRDNLSLNSGFFELTSQDFAIDSRSPLGVSPVLSGDILARFNEDLIVGEADSGKLDVSDDARLQVFGSLILASEPGAHGAISLDGADASIDANGLFVGHYDVATLDVTDGSQLSSDSAIIGDLASGDGTITVAGDGTLWASGPVVVGRNGTATATFNTGARVRSGITSIGALAGSTGSVLLSDVGSRWNVLDDVHVGGSDAGAGGAGSLTVAQGAEASISTALHVWQNGRLIVDEGTVSADRVQLNGGELSGRGDIAADTINDGVVSPGVGIGVLNVTGDYSQTGTLHIEIGGTVSGSSYDRFNVSGLAELGGSLDVRLTGGFRPTIGDRFEVLGYVNRLGEFDILTGVDLGNGVVLVAEYGTDSMTLVAQAAFPAAPTFLSPSTTTTDTTPTFAWTQIGGADHYELLVYHVAEGRAVINQTNRPGTTFTPSTALAGATYQAFVRAVDGSGTPGRYSFALNFVVSTSAGAIPGITTVTNPFGTTDDATPTIAWTAADRAESYELYVYNKALGREVIREQALTATSFTPISALPNGLYQVFVIARNSIGRGPQSPAFEFVINADSGPPMLPGQPTLIAPVGSTNDATPSIAWNTVGAAVVYELLIYNMDTGQEILSTQTNIPSFTPSTPLPAARIQAFVRGFNDRAQPGAFSAPLEFRVATATPVPPVPVLTTPNGTTNDATPEIAWTSSGDGTVYEVHVYDVNRGQRVVYETRIATASFVPTTPLSNGRYQVFVRGIDENGQMSAFSAPLEFTLNATLADSLFASPLVPLL